MFARLHAHTMIENGTIILRRIVCARAIFYKKYEPYIDEMKRRWDASHSLRDLTYLYEEMRRIRGERGLPLKATREW